MGHQSEITSKAKPFLKWAGGKTQLLPTIDAALPKAFTNKRSVTYIEPFVGGGAMLFHMLKRYPNIHKAVINDLNTRLINTYIVIRDKPNDLILLLQDLEQAFLSIKDQVARKDYYLSIRDIFNSDSISDVQEAACMIFLNRTCFNGLYRENSRGGFNVPFGKYSNPKICDEALIYADSALLQKVDIIQGDFSQTLNYAEDYTFFYLDPPYRPLDATSSFNSYVKTSFDDSEQIRLRDFFADISKKGFSALLSNSDCSSRNAQDTFFDDIYADFTIQRVSAKRCINANPAKRGNITELLIRNYISCQGNNPTPTLINQRQTCLTTSRPS
ncbi:MAG: DNA adenine methylase [Bacteroides sp.]|nr:DNA adenine methylase [Bacteroides sp.]